MKSISILNVVFTLGLMTVVDKFQIHVHKYWIQYHGKFALNKYKRNFGDLYKLIIVINKLEIN